MINISPQTLPGFHSWTCQGWDWGFLKLDQLLWADASGKVAPDTKMLLEWSPRGYIRYDTPLLVCSSIQFLKSFSFRVVCHSNSSVRLLTRWDAHLSQNRCSLSSFLVDQVILSSVKTGFLASLSQLLVKLHTWYPFVGRHVTELWAWCLSWKYD